MLDYGIAELAGSIDALWLIVSAALVFFMQAGFAMVESGFTRAKNAGNIVMKNTLDFVFATIVYVAIGYSLAYGTDLAGIIGSPTFFLSGFEGDLVTVLFQLVFAGATATIVSGAMAERTKFSSYMVYAIVICAFVYPVVTHWVWSADGWLCQLGYIDFAGSTAVHMLGGITALLGAYFLGPRIGKYDKDGNARALPGHNLTLAALGVFILWFGWFGFNGGSTLAVSGFDGAATANSTAEVLLITCIAASAGALGAMIMSMVRYKHPDVSYTLNGVLAGLVGICAGAAVVDYYGALVIGFIAGIVVVVAADFVEKKLRIDDPVGAFAVHGAAGMVGTLLVAFLMNPDKAGTAGLLYGGGMDALIQLGIQVVGIVAIAAWSVVLMGATFWIIKHTIGLRVTPEEEIAGLDITEHGLVNAYSGLMPDLHKVSLLDATKAPMAMADETIGIPVMDYSEPVSGTLKKIVVITRREKLGDLKAAMDSLGITGMTISYVEGYGAQKGQTTMYRGVEIDSTLLPKLKVEIVTSISASQIVEAARKAIYTGAVGDGKIFVYDVENAIRVRTGETGVTAVSSESE
ncbi:MAG: ammonium transporter [Candidatus Methanomethylophilaceae archaeon]|nr:ammonium transporter [Candidatus Methanomethylophilaceae archaeon]